MEWHDFECADRLDWARSFHPESLEICVNFEGHGTIRERTAQTEVAPQTVAHYSPQGDRLKADREADQRHRFLTVEMSRDWLAHAVRGHEGGLNRETRNFLDGGSSRAPRARELPLNPRVKRITEEMLKPPVKGPGVGFWFHAKILEIAAHTLTEPEDELFCQRHKRIALERIERVKQILMEDLEHPPALPQLGREVGCSPFYLSRVFSEHTGMTISRYLRNLRLERASELLRTGQCNVTEAAMAVGYSSLSHFSKAFAEMYGACPCVFPLKK